MSQEFRRVGSADLNDQLRLVVEERLHEIVSARQPGHCMRVGDLDTVLMMSVGRNLAEALGARAQIHVLSRDAQSGDPLAITSSKLVELRNVPADGVQRPPLLVFVPNDLRTAAEDSFAEATFEQISIADCFSLLRKRLIEQLPREFRSAVEESLRVIEERHWRWADDTGSVRFLLSILLNGLGPEIVGASLCEIGLVPDFHLLDDVSALPYRLAKNLECVQKLTFSTKSERGRVLDLNLKDHAYRATLSDFLDQCGLEDPLIWCRRIVSEKQLWPLSFDKWCFEDSAGFTQQVQVEVLQLGLPVIQADETDARLRQLIGQQVLLVGKGGPKTFKVKFRSNPAPETLHGLDHFRLQVVAREAGPTAFTKKKKAWIGSRQDASVSFTNISKVEWEDGWHFVKVLPCSVDGDPIPLVDAQGQPVPLIGGQDDGQFPNESDLFYVVKADDVEIDVPQRAVPKFPSFNHALIHFWFTALANGRDPDQVTCTHRAWVESEDNKGKGELSEFKFAGEGLVHVPISRILKILQQRILSASDELVSWRLTISSSQTADLTSEYSTWPALPEMEEFRAARRDLFAKIRGDDKDQILECTDLSTFRSEIAQLAERYLAVLAQALRLSESATSDQQPRLIAQVQRLLTIDTALVDISDHHGGHRAALLVGPTHPLRLLWLATWLTLARDWLDKARKAPKEYINPTRDALLERLRCVNFPAVFPLVSGQLFSAVDNLHPYWSVYSSESEGDSRGLMTEICMALGLPEPNIGSFSLNGRFLADRVRRYLVQHPYINTLALNCFNAGQGKLLVEVLLELQMERDFHDLRYDIRLFVADPDAPGAGADLSDLISPGSTLTVAEADAFATPTGTHLAPKLAFSVRDILDFRNKSSEFPAHLSLLFDVFPAQNISAKAPRAEDESAPVHGLLQEFTVDYVEDAELVAWNRRPRHGLASPIPGASEFSTLLARLAETISTAAAKAPKL